MDGTILVINVSVEHPNAPITKNFVRGFVPVTGFFIAKGEDTNSSNVTYIQHSYLYCFL